MREDDGRKLDHQTLEALRLRAVEQVARGVPAAEVGAAQSQVVVLLADQVQLRHDPLRVGRTSCRPRWTRTAASIVPPPNWLR